MYVRRSLPVSQRFHFQDELPLSVAPSAANHRTGTDNGARCPSAEAGGFSKEPLHTVANLGLRIAGYWRVKTVVDRATASKAGRLLPGWTWFAAHGLQLSPGVTPRIVLERFFKQASPTRWEEKREKGNCSPLPRMAFPRNEFSKQTWKPSTRAAFETIGGSGTDRFAQNSRPGSSKLHTGLFT